jgi:DNA invertase Pin-like site-specific DNA recombinase
MDGNPNNNNLTNLVWGTHKENSEDRRRHGRVAIGELNANASLTDNAVREILHLLASGMTQRGIARKYDVSQHAIGRIKRGEGWTHIQRTATQN